MVRKGWSRAAALLALAGSLSIVGPTACKTDPGEVRKQCEVRKGWQHAMRRDCTDCLAKASAQKCNVKCTDRDYSGKCADAHKAFRQEPTCEGVPACVKGCGGDCDCTDRCYEGKATCLGLGGVVDACTTRVCDEFCR